MSRTGLPTTASYRVSGSLLIIVVVVFLFRPTLDNRAIFGDESLLLLAVHHNIGSVCSLAVLAHLFDFFQSSSFALLLDSGLHCGWDLADGYLLFLSRIIARCQT